MTIVNQANVNISMTQDEFFFEETGEGASSPTPSLIDIPPEAGESGSLTIPAPFHISNWDAIFEDTNSVEAAQEASTHDDSEPVDTAQSASALDDSESIDAAQGVSASGGYGYDYDFITSDPRTPEQKESDFRAFLACRKKLKGSADSFVGFDEKVGDELRTISPSQKNLTKEEAQAKLVNARRERGARHTKQSFPASFGKQQINTHYHRPKIESANVYLDSPKQCAFMTDYNPITGVAVDVKCVSVDSPFSAPTGDLSGQNHLHHHIRLTYNPRLEPRLESEPEPEIKPKPKFTFKIKFK